MSPACPTTTRSTSCSGPHAPCSPLRSPIERRSLRSRRAVEPSECAAAAIAIEASSDACRRVRLRACQERFGPFVTCHRDAWCVVVRLTNRLPRFVQEAVPAQRDCEHLFGVLSRSQPSTARSCPSRSTRRRRSYAPTAVRMEISGTPRGTPATTLRPTKALASGSPLLAEPAAGTAATELGLVGSQLHGRLVEDAHEGLRCAGCELHVHPGHLVATHLDVAEALAVVLG